jgi:type I restriction enzyme, S subunit
MDSTILQPPGHYQERLIALTTELKKALLHKLFTEGLRGEPQKQTEIGPVPESWKIVELESLLVEAVRNGHSAKATNGDSGVRTLTLTAVTQRDFSVENTKLTSADPMRVSDLWLRSGDILVERANTPEYVGLAALYEGPEDFAIYPDLMIRVRVDCHVVDPYFIAEFLVTPECRRYFQRSAHSTAGNFPKIDQATVEKTLLPLPGKDEERDIVLALRSIDRMRELYRRKAKTLRDLFSTLLHQLMTAQIRVNNLTLQHPAQL